MPDVRTGAAPPRTPGLGTVVIDDLRRGDLGPVIRRDLRHLYDFYLTEERRERLARMNRVKGAFVIAYWLLLELVQRLPPARRLLLLASFVCAVFGRLQFSAGDVQFSLSLAPLAFGLVLVVLMLELKDRLLAHDELSVGRQVQMALLPKTEPIVPGWAIWIYTRPANHVGGDLVDYVPLAAGAAGLALGDVAGKGLGAALLMAKLQSTLRAVAPGTEHLGEMGARVNRILCRDGLPNRFATLVYAEVEPGAGTVRLLNAGHLPVVVLRSDSVEFLQAPAPPLGVLPDTLFEEQRLTLATGETVVIHSDGLSDARDAAGHYFGEQELAALWPALSGRSPAEIGAGLLAAVQRFSGDTNPDDDLSVVVIQRSG